MDFVLRCVVLALAGAGASALLASAVVAGLWRAPAGTAAQRADWLWRLRLLPLASAVGAGLFAVIGLWRFEERHSDEVLGWVVRGVAAFGAVFLVAFVVRLVQMHLETRRLLRIWLAGASRLDLQELAGLRIQAYRIETHFPVVAVVGIVRPTLVVDASVLDACSPAEISAILAHEQGHLRRCDNVRRAVFAATPDLLGWMHVGPALRDAWRDATEEAADDVAAERGEEARVQLARALVRVARLACGAMPTPSTRFQPTQLPASALYRGDTVERRVRRLMNPPAAIPTTGHRWSWVAVVASALAFALAMQREIHGLMEVAVSGLW